MRKMTAPTALLLLFICASTASAAVKGDVKKGNLLYNNGRYDEAMKFYQDAQAKDPDSGIVNFNIADALYKKGSYDNAVSSFNKSIASGDAGVVQGADFNIGNVQYKLGLRSEPSNINKAKEFYEIALKYYKRAIDLDPGDKAAKFNYEFVDARIKSLEEKKSEKEQKKEDQKKDEKKDQQQNKQQNEQKQDQNQQDKQNKDQNQQKDSQQQQQKDQQQQQQQGSEPDQSKGSEAKKEESQKGGQEEQSQDGKDEEEKSAKDEKSEEDKGQQGAEEKSDQGEGEKEGSEEHKTQEQGAEETKPAEEQGQEEDTAGAGEKTDGEEAKDEKGLEFYQSGQEETGKMSEQEAKMLLEGYRGEEATGKSIKLRRKPLDTPDPDKNW